MLEFIKDGSKIFIAAPANFATGGPELLHQLAFKLKEKGRDVSMFYLPSDHPDPVHENYRKYGIDFVRKIYDEKDNILIVPETKTQTLTEYAKIRKIIWWLSVDNYFFSLPGLKGKLNRVILNTLGLQNYFFFNKQIKSADYHLVQSEYAKVFLNKKRVDNIGYLSDYLHDYFFNMETSPTLKENLVAYNPKKGINFTKKLMSYSPDIEFVAIENMSRDEVAKLLQRAKVYIDFGFHPGKDRIPREAACLRCCVITNRRGSAYFKKDVDIDDEFKFEETDSNLDLISRKIRDCFTNYSENIGKFDHYRQEIRCQEVKFDEQVRDLFG